MQNILVACVGNICRSPLAEVMLARQLPHKKVWSAGLSAVVGSQADPLACEVAEAGGYDLSAHRAQQLTSLMCQMADLILVMETSHQVEVERRYPWSRGKVYRLGEVEKFDIPDPYRKELPAFEAAYAQISRGVNIWAQRIQKLG